MAAIGSGSSDETTRIAAATRKPWKGRDWLAHAVTLIALVGSVGAIYWGAVHLWETQHPMVVAARSLESSKAAERAGATREVGHARPEDRAEAIVLIIRRLNDEDADVRVAAVASLGQLIAGAVAAGTEVGEVSAAVSTLVGSLKDGQSSVREAASIAVGISVPALHAATATQALVDRLNDQEPSVRKAAIFALVMIIRRDVSHRLDLRPVNTAVLALVNDRQAGVRDAAVSALGIVGPRVSEDPPAPLSATLEDESADTRDKAVEALVQFRVALPRQISVVLQSLEKARPEARESYLKLLGRIRPPAFSAEAVPGLIRVLESRDPQSRVAAATGLAAYKEEAKAAIPSLIKVAREPMVFKPESLSREELLGNEPSIAAINALGSVACDSENAGRVVAVLTEIVRSGRSEQKMEACHAMQDLEEADRSGVIPVLIATLREVIATEQTTDSRDPAYSGLTGVSVVRALANLADRTSHADTAARALTEALSARSIWTRSTALSALRRYGSKAACAIPRLRELAKTDPESMIREEATHVLEEVEQAQIKGK